METLVSAIAADLVSPAPFADEADRLAAFVPLLGSWDLRFVYRRANGERTEGTGRLHFGWGLGGRAIVDVWAFEGGVVGTTIRFYDPQIDGIRSTWICPARNAVVPFIGRLVGGRIMLNARTDYPPGRRVRWSFVSIEAARFSWTGEVSDDEGANWFLNQEIEGVRRSIA